MSDDAPDSHPLSLLTDRKQAIARHVASGFSDKQIAAMVSLDEETVAYHLRGIARIWRLDPTKKLRVQITQRVFFGYEQAS